MSMPRDWDATTYDRVAEPQTRWGRVVLDRLALDGDETVLDAGCGSGRITEQLAERLPHGRVIALDASPSLVAEVSSPSTRPTDRREKLDAYMRSPSWHVYLVVEQRRRHVLAYTRDDVVGWVRHEIVQDGDIVLGFLDSTISMDEIYDDVTLPPLRVGEEWNEWNEWNDEETEEL